jgi:hypothetical protein
VRDQPVSLRDPDRFDADEDIAATDDWPLDLRNR